MRTFFKEGTAIQQNPAETCSFLSSTLAHRLLRMREFRIVDVMASSLFQTVVVITCAGTHTL
jgi:hypothetical protein